MQVILLERIEKLGTMGEVVNVKSGYARNFLLPQQKALRATKANLARFEAEREFLEARNAEARDRASDDGKAIDGNSYVIIRKAGETGQLYGSVSSRDVVEAMEGAIKRNMVKLENPIKALGLHEVEIKLHAEVSSKITLNVARSKDEAERQARGEDVIASQFAEDKADAETESAERAAIAAEMFDDNFVPETLGEDGDDATDEAAPTPAETPAEAEAPKGEEEE